MLYTTFFLCLAFQSATPTTAPTTSKVQVQCGHWEPSFMHTKTGFPQILPRFNAAHMALIPKGPNRGKVIAWDIHADSTAPSWIQRWSIVDPTTPAFQNFLLPMPANEGDLFCAGLSWTSEGDLLVAGGTLQYPGLMAASLKLPKHPMSTDGSGRVDTTATSCRGSTSKPTRQGSMTSSAHP